MLISVHSVIDYRQLQTYSTIEGTFIEVPTKYRQ